MKIDETNTVEAVNAYYQELINELGFGMLDESKNRDAFLKEMKLLFKEWKEALDNLDD